jgi:ParB-like chromosome segregation protein Spo0J
MVKRSAAPVVRLHTEHEVLPVSDLAPYARNSRTHSAEQVEQIAASLREFGFTNPVLVDEAGGIIAGHGRVMAAQSLGLDKVPCLRLRGLSEAQKRAYVIADNKLALNAGWDNALLRAELEDLKGLGYNLDIVGFSPDELEALFDPVVKDTGADPDAAPGLSDKSVSGGGRRLGSRTAPRGLRRLDCDRHVGVAHGH